MFYPGKHEAAPPPGTHQAPSRERYVWETRWGPINIEVLGDQVWVDGKLVELARPNDLTGDSPPRS